MSDNDSRTPLLPSSEPFSQGIPNQPFDMTSPNAYSSFQQPYMSIASTSPNIDANNFCITQAGPYSGFDNQEMLFNLINPTVPEQQQYEDSTFNILTSPSFDIEYVEFPDKLFKVQRRTSGYSQQRIKNGNISFVLNFQTSKTRNQVSEILVHVKRASETDNVLKRVGKVPVNAQLEPVQNCKYLVKMDWDSVYEYDGKKVYELERSLTDELNTFHLIITVKYKNNQIISKLTKNIQLIGKEKKQKPKQTVGEKRPHTDSITSTSSLESLLTSGIDSPSSLFTQPYSPPEDTGLISARKVVAEHIKTKTLEVDGLMVGTVKSAHGDIAYHHIKQDSDAVFEEGEIGALVPDEKDTKKHVIAKMNLKNLPNVVLAGVVTRSQYFEAHVPAPGVASETICMMGVVPVQVVGSVLANEALYAAVSNPGFAISGHHLDIADLKDSIFIGYAFSSRKTADEESVGFVNAGVSVLETAGKCMLNQRLRDVEENFDEKIDNIKESRKRSRKCVIIFGIILTILLVLLSCFFWQLLMPGSAYRYYICKSGRKTSPERSSFYNFIPYRDRYSYPRVNGIEFNFENLLKKSHHTDYKPLNLTEFNITGVRYYLNIDRCAYGGLRRTGDGATGGKRVYGADVFAVDNNCFYAYYYDENKKSGWVKYRSVSWPLLKNLFCTPSPQRLTTMSESSPLA